MSLTEANECRYVALRTAVSPSIGDLQVGACCYLARHVFPCSSLPEALLWTPLDPAVGDSTFGINPFVAYFYTDGPGVRS